MVEITFGNQLFLQVAKERERCLMNTRIDTKNLRTSAHHQFQPANRSDNSTTPRRWQYLVLGLVGLCLLMLTGCTTNMIAASTETNAAMPSTALRQFTVEKGEVAYIATAVVNSNFPAADWTKAGWVITNKIGASDAVPQDCQLHAREGVAGQFFAACPGPAQLSVPREGADFIYIALMFGKNSSDKIKEITTPRS
jgi:hypothetical protein